MLPFFALLYSLAMTVASLLVMAEEDNSLFWPSHWFLFFTLFCAAIGTNLFLGTFRRFKQHWSSLSLVFFLGYYVVSALINTQATTVRHFSYLRTEIFPSLLLSFYVFGKFELNWKPKIHLGKTTQKVLFCILLLVTSMAFLVLGLYCFLKLSEMTRIDLFVIDTAGKESFYQLFGQNYLRFFLISLVIQYQLFHRIDERPLLFPFFSGIVILQCLLSFFLLQMAGSNKDPIALLIAGILSIWYAKPPNWLFQGWDPSKWKKRTLVIFPAGIIVLLIFIGWIGNIDLPPLRIFGYGRTSLLESSSLVSRNQIILELVPQQIADYPVFGNLSDPQYAHSFPISIQTHLGIVGSILMLSFLIIRLIKLYAQKGLAELKMTAPAVLALSFIGTFFIWSPAWFILGGLFIVPFSTSQKCCWHD